MSALSKLVLAAAIAATVASIGAHAGPKRTVCTITVNSSDEKEAFRQRLPADQFQFVELVERGRPDWLASACQQGVRCDILVISGHYDGGNEFFSDRVESAEYLPVDEMERVSCSASCPGLFSQLKEVYLFGCNTLNGEAQRSASAEIARSLVRSGHPRADAERVSRALSSRHGESSRDRMRLIFKDVPAIYGFSSVAPLGPSAASLLNRHLQGGTAETGSGRVNNRLLASFSAHSMTATSGMRDNDPQAAHRRDVCNFADDRMSAKQKLAFVHGLLGREMAEVRMFLDRLEKYAGSLDDAALNDPAATQALAAITRDDAARGRFLDFARDADQPGVRARMLEVARNLGWLTAAEERAELVRMFDELMTANAIRSAEVDLACTLNKDHSLDQDATRLQRAGVDRVANAAVLACFGNADGHARVLRALTSPSDADVQIAQVYVRHRPIADVNELREVTTGIARMNGSSSQVRALQALAHHHVSDPESLDELTRLFPVAESVGVQLAIASVLLRSDYHAIDKPELVQTLRQHRLKSPDGANMIDVLIRRLEAR